MIFTSFYCKQNMLKAIFIVVLPISSPICIVTSELKHDEKARSFLRQAYFYF